MDVLNEKSGVEFTAHFSDVAHEPTIPGTVHWGLTCVTSNTVLQEDSLVSATIVTDESGLTDAYATIEVPGQLNSIQSNRNSRELKQLIVIADKDTGREYSQTYQYYVRNLNGRS